MTHVDHKPASIKGERVTSPRRRMRSRWWLAGLLVGCLLPAGLVGADAVRQAERIVQICLLAPCAIRAESRRAALHRRWPGRRRLAWPLPRRLLSRQFVYRSIAANLTPCAAHDVLTRRGPPSRACSVASLTP
ncbi:hypothetical protein [Litchfieldella xinjiangensis]|uniref:hypothetical protein n=1 Tax=Litchfieldella xinjiangensis TaxID=1166948 RepID=UPI0009DDBBA0|nr:hypothetical protein [Halomonas xinjiangensis]